MALSRGASRTFNNERTKQGKKRSLPLESLYYRETYPYMNAYTHTLILAYRESQNICWKQPVTRACRRELKRRHWIFLSFSRDQSERWFIEGWRDSLCQFWLIDCSSRVFIYFNWNGGVEKIVTKKDVLLFLLHATSEGHKTIPGHKNPCSHC